MAMADRKKIINELQFQLNSKEVKDQHYPVQLSASDANAILALLKEQEPYDSKETTLNRDEYCQVGDVLDCFDGMDLKADEVFHAVNLIEWAMGKRSIPLDQLTETERLKEQEAVEPVRGEDDDFYCGLCGKKIARAIKIYDGHSFVKTHPDHLKPECKCNFCKYCGRAVKWNEQY